MAIVLVCGPCRRLIHYPALYFPLSVWFLTMAIYTQNKWVYWVNFPVRRCLLN
ncbi:hypothetical protein DC498_18805 [Terrimonas sp.]|nr:hypothetical protein DC498_18805 [Terrimonas sp.]